MAKEVWNQHQASVGRGWLWCEYGIPDCGLLVYDTYILSFS